MLCLPERGRVGVFNRSYYEEVLVVRVHPEILTRQKLPRIDKDIWQQRFEDINAFERHMVHNGTLVLKFFLHISKEEQRERFLARLDDPDKHWKFSLGDIAERKLWDKYMAAYEEMVRHTSLPEAPWYVVPADRKWFARVGVAAAMVEALERLNPAIRRWTPKKCANWRRRGSNCWPKRRASPPAARDIQKHRRRRGRPPRACFRAAAPGRSRDQRRDEIDAYFAELRRGKPALWNGQVLLLHEHALTGDVLRGSFLATDYASFLAWRDWDFPDPAMRNCFAMAALRAADGAFLLGVMGSHTANAGRVYFPGGTPDLDDVVEGRVDLDGSVRRELAEETGLDVAEFAARFRLVHGVRRRPHRPDQNPSGAGRCVEPAYPRPRAPGARAKPGACRYPHRARPGRPRSHDARLRPGLPGACLGLTVC